MKRLIALFICIVSVVTFFPLPVVHATPVTDVAESLILENGDYIRITTSSVSGRSGGTITKYKHYDYYNKNNEKMWRATLTGTFRYNGVSAVCTLSDCSVNIYNNAWYLVSKSSSKTGNSARATVTLGHKVSGITVSKKTYNITLTCDKNGNVS